MARTSRAVVVGSVVAAIALAWGCGEDEGVVGGTCAPPWVACGNQCVQTASDPNHCGSCDRKCAQGVACVQGVCADALDASTDADDPDSDARRDGGRREGGVGNDDAGEGGADDGGGNDGGGGDATSSDAAADADGGGGGCGQLLFCNNQCVDPQNDPDNCGSCGHACPSNLCVGGVCQGTAAGHVVVIGHDYQTAPAANSAQARVIGNALLIPPSKGVSVLSYEHYSVVTDVANVKAIAAAQAQKQGRTVTFTSTKSDSFVTSNLDINTFDILLVADQRTAGAGVMAALGATWSASPKINDFLKAGGVVIVLDGGTGTGEMPALLTATGLLSTSAHTVVNAPSLTVLSPGDAVGTGVLSPYVPTKSAVWLSTVPASSTVTYVVGLGSSQPVVVHRVVP